jgi:hypothetical protein
MTMTHRKLYHGTVVSRLDAIREQGIAPRSVTGAAGNVSETVATRCGYRRLTGDVDAVYVSDLSDPWHFALNFPGDDGPGLILELDADLLQSHLLGPDPAYPEAWFMYRGTIPWQAVTRYVVLDYDKLDDFWQHFVTHESDSPPFTKWLFGEKVAVADFLWPLKKYPVEDVTRKANRAWTRWTWANPADEPVDGLGLPEDDVEHCPVESRKWHIQKYAEVLEQREGVRVMDAAAVAGEAAA